MSGPAAAGRLAGRPSFGGPFLGPGSRLHYLLGAGGAGRHRTSGASHKSERCNFIRLCRPGGRLGGFQRGRAAQAGRRFCGGVQDGAAGGGPWVDACRIKQGMAAGKSGQSWAGASSLTVAGASAGATGFRIHRARAMPGARPKFNRHRSAASSWETDSFRGGKAYF